ncbi:sigma-54-dependent transcriptional regulator [Ideonella livida]|uniref:Sigma-54-dependent Fis family transcriptional regulator n=1 Tax=Ideonella livida TaxID=2707176 RepID=A0A7C9TKT7_9BURK|nr:sigma-54 dependent transcriptional regulator [Ideonella livida]NDY93059.1 sigma-54-dependent Fis family transcriptional regulator [Ideonella livida]
MAARHAILVVDDEPDLRTLYELSLLREGYEVESAGTVDDARQLLAARRFDVVITDMRLPDASGMTLVHELEASNRQERVIVITAYGSAENAVEALKAGAFDYLTKPVDLKQFRAVVAAAVGRRAEGTPVPPAAQALDRLAGTSDAMQRVRAMVQKVARGMAPVLVHGESGTGKELVARAIHECGGRAAQPFVAVNCGAIPENLLEAEFFGYRKGAFTGAAEDRPGFFQAAQGGTLFLDEIGDLPLAMQAKLLRVIQERCVRPLGAVQETALDVRIVSATHKRLVDEVSAGQFRQDLFYRLNVIGIDVPPLRDRGGDIPLIAQALLQRIARDAGLPRVPRLTPQAEQALQRCRLPGNVRELENLLHRAVTLSALDLLDEEALGLADASADVAGSGRAPEPGTPLREASVLSAAGEPPAPAPGAISLTPESFRAAADSGALPPDLARHLDEVERIILVRALQEHGFNRTAAGARLGLTLRQMRYRMARLGISEEEASDDA